jgi:hypothetical protein
MRSIPAAITWELLRRARWSLAAGLLGAHVLPLIILGALSLDGALDVHDPDLFPLQISLQLINMFLFGAVVASAQGTPSRLYTHPIATSSLVAWQLMTSMALVILECLLSTSILNTMYGMSWPLWGPALFAATAFAALQATIWFFEKSAWMPLAAIIVSVFLGGWYILRFRSFFDPRFIMWGEVTSSESVTLLAIACASWWIALAGVRRNRCGEPPRSLGIIDWLYQRFDFAPAVSASFRTPEEAQFWFEWQRKGWSVPATVIFGLVICLSGWAIFNRDSTQLIETLIFGGVLLSGSALICGLLMGHAGLQGPKYDMGHFLASRPMSTTSFARATLKVAGKSVLLAWTIWAATFLAVYVMMLATRAAPQPFLPRGLPWWYFPATLLGCWTVVAIVTSGILTGRTTLLSQLWCGLIAIGIAAAVSAKFGLAREAQVQLYYGVLTVIAIGFVGGSVWAFHCARKQRLIGPPTLLFSLGTWVILSSVVITEWLRQPVERLPVYLFVVGLAALSVVPLAAAPLALSWNRTR